MPPDCQIGDPGERYEDQITRIRRNTCKDAHECQDVGQCPARRNDYELAYQRRDQTGFLGHTCTDHSGDHKPHCCEAHEVGNERGVEKADAFHVQEAAYRRRSGFDFVRVRVDALIADRRPESTQRGRQNNNDADQDQEDDHGMWNHVSHFLDAIQ